MEHFNLILTQPMHSDPKMEAAVSHHESSQPQRLVSGRLEFSLNNCFFEEKGYLCVGRTRHEADLTRGRKRLRELI